MPAFQSPFAGNLPGSTGKMSTAELIRALRLDLAGELEAIATYNAHADACGDEKVAALLRDLADEERIHVGELLRAIEYLDSTEKNFVTEGRDEASKALGGEKDE